MPLNLKELGSGHSFRNFGVVFRDPVSLIKHVFVVPLSCLSVGWPGSDSAGNDMPASGLPNADDHQPADVVARDGALLRSAHPAQV